MQNFLNITKPVSKGYLPQVGNKGLVGYIDAKDIGRVAYYVLEEDQPRSFTDFAKENKDAFLNSN